MLSQLSKLQDKKPLIGPFLSPKNLNLILLNKIIVQASAVGQWVR